MRIRKDRLDAAVWSRYPSDARCPACGVLGMMMMDPSANTYRVACPDCGYSHSENWVDGRPVKVVIHATS